MKQIVLAAFLVASLLSCKKKTTEANCENQMCTEEFRSVSIKFVDNKGAAADVKDFSVVNQRTGEKVYANSIIAYSMIKGSYMVVDDGNTKSLSEQGDNLKITATSLATNQTKSVLIKVSGGECACHINKVSGPDQVTFD